MLFNKINLDDDHINYALLWLDLELLTKNSTNPNIADMTTYLFELPMLPVYFLMTNHMTNHMTPVGVPDYVHETHRWCAEACVVL